MAQTITQQKGSVSTTWDGSVTTLFTLSSGTSSRVILNSLSTYNDYGNRTPYIWFYIYNSAMGVRNPIAGTIYQVCSSIAWLPGNTSGPANLIYNSSGYTMNNGSFLVDVSGSPGPIGSKDPSYIGWNTSNNSATGSYFPAQFWMGNGDSLQVKGSWPSSSGVVYYSFTVVTES
jgi:hypothetical protein